ncbi:uncharacterized protein LY89DRAFT_722755 [Mollisia scopiformis]|uniref:F-box domain-containing protein n=1 Tax=Mollisia scopiformis TaxID=149040 RepID=A0A194WVN1_MOLSC|nr:uncharacterized protein LY89DRAFT_722755 [Mollisia scopiformis]KUJ11647.1 hypothetical protein LY89DRAFT_722755 [Mollisia scopiformis]
MAAPLFLLSPEIFCQIFSLLPPHGVFGVSLTCRFLLEVAKTNLGRHKELAQKHKVVYLGYSVEMDGLLSPIVYLDMIESNPNMAFYPRVVQMLEYSHDQSDGEGSADEGDMFEGRDRERGIMENRKGFRESVEACPYLTEGEDLKWKTAISENGDDDAALALLLSMLPNLKEIVIWIHYRPLPYTSQMVSRIAQATRLNPERTTALSKLQSFRLGQRGDTDADNLRFFLPFMELPSVWHIAGWRIKQEGRMNEDEDTEPIMSVTYPNIKMIDFEQSNVDERAMQELLSMTNHLSTFAYEVDGNMPYGVAFAPDVMVDALLQYSAHFLEELQLVVQPDWAIVEPWRFIMSLRLFQKLRTVEVDAEFLCQRDDDDDDLPDDMGSLVESMPETLETLALRYLRLDQIDVLFDGFGEKRQQRLKSLSKVILLHPDHGNRNAHLIVERVRKVCEDGCVELEVFDERGGFPFYDAIMKIGLIEKPMLCENYPTNWD